MSREADCYIPLGAAAVRVYGQEVLITVRGRVKARLVAAGPSPEAGGMARWVDRLADLRKRHGTGKSSPSTEEILEESREDRF